MNTPKLVEMRGNKIVARMLEKLGVTEMFAYPGGFSLELHQALSESSVRVVLPRHEQGGAFGADGYARISGKVGVCMATSGPGATNLLTGIADCYMDSIPTVFITGQVPANMIGKNVFQETDIIGMTRPIIKHSYLVFDAADIPRVMREAFYIAASGRPGPVLVDIPKNVQQQITMVDLDAPMRLDSYTMPPPPSAADIEKIKAMIKVAKRPLIYAGGGIITAECSELLQKFAESYNIPVVTTLMGIGTIPDDHPLSLRWFGMHGMAYANFAANEADLLIVLGARFDDRVTGDPRMFATVANIVHIDIDESEINKNKPATFAVVASVKEALAELVKEPIHKDYAEWFAQIKEWKALYPLRYDFNSEALQPQYVIETLARITEGKAVIVPGVGQHQMWAAQYYKYSYPRQFLTSGGLGSMGFGLPAAMGAKLACPEKLVINIDGDGSFQMNIQELGTLFVEGINVKMIILNNQHLGMVAQWEDRFYGGNRGNTVLGRCRGSSGGEDYCAKCGEHKPYPEFVQIAKGYGIPGRDVFKIEELEDAINEMLATDGPFLLDVHTGYQEHVLPMIPAGKDYKSIILK